MKLQDVCSYVADKIDNSALNIDNYISTENMMQNCGGITSASNVPVGKSTRFIEGDILFSNIRPYFKKLWRANISGGCSADVLCIRANEKIDPTYLYYLLTQDSFISYVMAGTKGCKMPRGDKQYNMAWNINLPSLDVQVKIAAQLSEIDNKIAVNRRICENLEAQAQALFKHWFIDFAPFKNGKFVESELGMIPEGWRVGKLGDYCKVKSGFAFKSSMWTEKGCPVIKIKNITNSGRIDMTDCSYISKQNVAKAKAFKANRGDLVIAMTGATIGKFSILPQFDDETYINQRVGKFFLGNNPLEKLPYVFCLLSDNRNRKQLTTMGQGSAQPNISGSDIESIIAVYSNNVIESFNEICYPMFDMILTKQEENLRLSTLRDALLPKLMSGQIKV